MRCRTVERRISDALDGPPARRRAARVEAHLASCPGCREYRRRLLRLQAEARRSAPPEVSPGFWDASIVRLRGRLESPGPGAAPSRGPAFFPPSRPVWQGAVALLAAAAGLYILVARPHRPLEPFPLSQEEATSRLVALVGSDQELEADFADLLQASIREHADVQDRDVPRLLYAKSHFLDSLSDEELQVLDSHIARELKI